MVKLGIDFGTTTTVVEVVAASGGAGFAAQTEIEIIPSVVAFAPSGRVEIGKKAKARRLIDPQNTLYSVKRIIGKSWLSLEVSDFRKEYPFALEQGADSMPRFVTRSGKLTAAEVASYLLAHVRERFPARVVSGADVRLTVPASFKADQRRSTVDAAIRAGFDEVTLVEEPHAAALAHREELEDGQTVVVYDLGGGTFDVAVLRIHGNEAQVVAVGGDAYLGGDDIDLQCANWAADEILQRYHWDVRSDSRGFQSLLFACERAKMRLSETSDTVIPLAQVDQVLEGKDLMIERRQLVAVCGELIQRTFVICDDVLARAGLNARQVHAVVLAGGGAYIPSIRTGVARYFDKEPLVSAAPDRVIARGAALI